MEEPLQSVGADKVNWGNPDGQGEGSDTNTGNTPFSLGRSPPQNGNSGVEKTSGTGGLWEVTPKVRFFNCNYDLTYRLFGYTYVLTILHSEGSNGDDIFGESPARLREAVNLNSLASFC